MKKKYFVVGTFFGIQLRIHYSWFFIFGLVAWAVITSYVPAYRNNLSTAATVAAGLVVTIIFFVSVVAHEYAHSLVANRRGLDIKRITLFLFGGASELEQEPDTAKTELLMTAAGPLTSLGLAALFAAAWLLARQADLTALEVICGPVALLNLVVGIFNLLPAFPLDGGRILRSLLWMIRNDFLAATRSATTVGVAFSYLLIALGVVELFGGYLLGGSWIIVIAFFMLQSARISYVQTVYDAVLKRRKVGDMMSGYAATVPANTSLRQFLADYVLARSQYDFVVVDDMGTPTGIIQMAALSETPLEELNMSVTDYMMPLQSKLVLSPGDSAAKAFRTMQTNGVNLLPVMTAQKLLGVIQKRYLEDYVQLQPIKQPLALPQ